MERFYYVKPSCQLAVDYWANELAEQKIIELFNKFADEKGIGATKFHPSIDQLWIIPTEEDETKYKDEFLKDEPGKFKKKSATNKEWIAKCKENKLVASSKIVLPMYIKFNGTQIAWRLFDVNNSIYCTISCDEVLEVPEGFQELKGSEFYTIMESYHIELS